MSLIQFIPGETALHRLDPRTKLGFIPFIIALAFIFNQPLLLAILVILTFAAWLYVRAPISYMARMIVIILVLTLFITLIQGIFYSQRSSEYILSNENNHQVEESGKIDLIPRSLRVGVISDWFGDYQDEDRLLTLNRDGVLLGLTLGMRLGSIISIVPLITMTTPLTDLMLAMVKMKIPWNISYLVVTSFRFVPLLMNQTDTILNAQKLRGLSIEKAGLYKRMTAYAPLAIPVILGAFRSSEQLEMVLACRGFTNIKERTSLYQIGWKTFDTVVVCVMVLVLLASIFILYI